MIADAAHVALRRILEIQYGNHDTVHIVAFSTL